MEEIHKGRKIVRTIGKCIYCGRTADEIKLTEEHIIPYSLGADSVLKDASCTECAKITKSFELHVARNVYGQHRIHADIQTRHPEQRPCVLPLRIIQGGVEIRRDLPIQDHAYFLALPVWESPGVFRGIEPKFEFDGLTSHLYYWVPPNIKSTLELEDGEAVEIRPNEVRIDANQFARLMAKIAYCNAIGTLGLDGFDAGVLPDLILGKYANIGHYVGSKLCLPPPPDRNGPMHSIEMFDVTLNNSRWLWSKIRLFAKDGTDERGMPYYYVVVGKPITHDRS